MGLRLENGYEAKTTFAQDFAIAEAFGIDAIEETFNRAFNEWKNDVVYATELAIVMNLRCWYFYEEGKEEISMMYSDYYYKVREYCLNHFKGKDLDYYLQTTD